MKVGPSKTIQTKHELSRIFARHSRPAHVFRDRYARLSREKLNGLRKCHALILFKKLKNIAAALAAKAMVDLLSVTDIEAWCLFFMIRERTKAFEASAGAGERRVLADDINNIVGVSNSFDEVGLEPQKFPPLTGYTFGKLREV